MSVADREKWNSKYSRKDFQPVTAPVMLLQNLEYFKPGTVLDVASGDGAAALYLAQKSQFKVTAIDISNVALSRLQQQAADLEVSIETHSLDLDAPQALAALGQFDNLCLFRFKPSLELVQRLAEQLKIGGRLIIATFNHHQPNFNLKFCLQPKELVAVDHSLQLISYHTSSELPFYDTYIFEKNGSTRRACETIV